MSTEVLHVESSRELPLVTIMIGFRAGSVLDPPGKEGLTRLTARMLRRGTAHRNAEQIENDVDAMGADLGEYVGPSATTISVDVIRRSFDRAVDLLCEILGEPSFDEQELGKLVRETIGSLIEARNSDRGLCVRAFRRTMYAGHPFGRRAAGFMHTLPTIVRADVVAQASRVLTRDNMIIAFAGDIDDATALKAAERIRGVLPTSGGAERVVPEPFAPEGRHLVFVDKPDRTQTQVLIGCLGTAPTDEDHVALSVAATVFGGTFSSRLMKEVRSKRGWSYGVAASLPVDVCRESFTVWSHPGVDDAAACIALELKLLERWWHDGVTPRELAFTKRFLTRSHAFEIDTPAKRAQLAFSVSLYGWPQDYYTGYLERVASTTIEAANQAIRSRIDLERMVVAVAGTHATVGEAVRASIPGLRESKVVPHDEE